MPTNNPTLSNIRNLIKIEDTLKTENDVIIRIVTKTNGSTLLKKESMGFIVRNNENIYYHGLGCLESQLQSIYNDLFETKGIKKISFDLSEKGDIIFGSQTYCQGSTEFLLAYINNDIKALLLEGIEKIKRGQSFTITFDNTLVLIPPQPRIYLYGINTSDIIHFKNLAEEIGFKITLFDFRDKNIEYLKRTYQIDIIKAFPEEIYKHLYLYENTFFIIMTHNFDIDQQLLKLLLPTPIKYIGLLSSKARFAKIFELLKKSEPKLFTSSNIGKLYSPCGLDLNGASYLEILLSVLAEVVTVYNQGSGRHLKINYE